MDLFAASRDRLNVTARRPLLAYGISVLSVALALLLTLYIPAIYHGTPFVFFFLAITLCAWLGGSGPGLLAISLSAVSTAYWVLPPANTLALTAGQLVQLVGFLLVSSVIFGLVVNLQRERTTVLAQRETLRLTLASIGDAVIVTDAQGMVRWLNEVAVTLTGWSNPEAAGRPLPDVFAIIQEQTRLPVENPVQQALTAGRVVGLANHTILVGKDGVERAIEDSAAPIRDETGAIYGVVLVFRDITERRRSGTLRQAAEERFTKAFQASPDAFAISRQADGAILEVNDSWERLFGYRHAEVVGQTALALQLYVNPAERGLILQQYQSQGRVRNYEVAVRTRIGAVREVSLAIETMQIHEQPCLLTILHDITERKQAEAALQQSNAILSAVLESTTDAVFVRNLTGHYLLVNTAGAEQVGMSKEAIISRHYSDLFSPKEAEEMQQDDRPVVEQGLTQTVEHRTEHNGVTQYWHTRKMPLRNVAGEIIGLVSSARDFTERKQAEAALRASEEKFAKAFHASPQAMCITRVMDGRYLEVNESFARLVDWPQPEIIGRTSFDVGIWSDPNLRAATNQRILEDGSNRDFEHSFRTRTGAWRDIVAAGVALEVNGEPCILSLVNDVTEQKRAAAALRESEIRFRASFEQAGVGMAQISLEHRYLRVNARLCEITGYSQEALLQKSYQDITYADDLAPNVTLANQLFAGEVASYQIEKRYIRADGTLVWVNITATAVSDPQGTVQYQIAVIEDITARKVAEARLLFLAETSGVLATSLDYALTLQRVTELMVPQLADLCTVELLGPDQTILPVAAVHVNPAKLNVVQQLRTLYPPQFDNPYGIGQVLRSGVAAFYPAIQTERLLTLAPDATYLSLVQQIGFKSTLIVPLHVRGQTLGTLTLAWTERERRYTEADLQLAEEVAQRAALAVDNARLYQAARQAERELRQLNESLEQHVAMRTSELQRSNRELDQFAYVASHDLRAPLRAIDQLASWISQDNAAVLPAPSQIHLAKLRGRVQRMDKLLNDLLHYSRAGRQRHPVEQVDSGELLQNLVDLLAPPAGFTIHLLAPFPVLLTERVPLETVLRNLIGNALKHHDHPQNGNITVSAVEQADMVVFTVTDDGPGIDPQFHERIFQMFQTLKPRDQVEGSGVGLAIVKKIVETYGGVITVESNVGHGATFRFTWPEVSSA